MEGVPQGLLSELLSDIRNVRVLAHLRKAHLDYGKSISVHTGIPLAEVLGILERLESMGVVERSMGSSLKRTKAKMKLSDEVHKHHTYYSLTRLGNHATRDLEPGALPRAYATILARDVSLAVALRAARDRGARPQPEALSRLCAMGLLECPRDRLGHPIASWPCDLSDLGMAVMDVVDASNKDLSRGDRL